MSGFRSDQDEWVSKCPSCGRFVANDDAYYCHEIEGDECVAAFCSGLCADGYPKVPSGTSSNGVRAV